MDVWVRYFEPGGLVGDGDKLGECPGQERALDDDVSRGTGRSKLKK